jgi:glutaconate CoA-transferase, subunit B
LEIDQVQEATGWDLQVVDDLGHTPPPTDEELSALRELLSR